MTPAIYDSRKQAIASVLVWSQVTQGEHLFAPLVIAEKHGRGDSDLRRAVTAIVHRSDPKNTELQAALTAYAQRLCLSIDSPLAQGAVT